MTGRGPPEIEPTESFGVRENYEKELDMERWLDIGAALLAFAAAIFWFLSAYGRLPPMVPYWDHVPANDPFYMAVKFSATMNRLAAALSGASALCIGLKLFA